MKHKRITYDFERGGLGVGIVLVAFAADGKAAGIGHPMLLRRADGRRRGALRPTQVFLRLSSKQEKKGNA